MNKLNKVRQLARKYNIKGKINYSTNPKKKFDLIYNNKKISFGQKGYEDYLDHNDDIRRYKYLRRSSNIFTKDGRRAVDIPYSPAFLSYYLLW
jgi:hypothetical protein